MSETKLCAHFSRQNYTGEELAARGLLVARMKAIAEKGKHNDTFANDAERKLGEMMIELHRLRHQPRSANTELMAQHAEDTGENARLMIENQKLKAQLEKQNLSHDDLCRLSRCFHGDNIGDWRYDQDRRINDWLKVQIMNAKNREKELKGQI